MSRPPGPRARLPFGLYFRYSRDPLGFLLGLARDYGDIVRFDIARQEIFFLNHPDYIKEVLVTQSRHFVKCRSLKRAKRLLGEGLLTSDGDLHRRQRRLVQPAFHHGRIALYAEVMTGYAHSLSSRWQDGLSVDMHEEMMRLTLAIVAKTLFNAEVEEEAGAIGRALGDALEVLSLMPSPLAPLTDRLPLPHNVRFKRAKARLDKAVYKMVAERRRGGENSYEDSGDLLSMLLMAREGGARMTDRGVRDEAITLLLAGHETTANALTWTWYLLARHPEVERELHAELESVLGDTLPSLERLKDLPYTKMVFSEALRLYPPAYIIGRRAVTPCTVGGYSIPAGAIINMSQYVMHRDPRYYPDPERFKPERWHPEAQAARPKFAYFPFGGGPRVCIGEAFAWMEGMLVLATLARDWRMHPLSDEPAALEPLLTLRPKGVRLVLERR